MPFSQTIASQFETQKDIEIFNILYFQRVLMIPNTKLRVVESSLVTASATFGISVEDESHLMTILRDTLYSDKILAVIREYASNAWDAHRDAGKAHIPIKVTLPTEMNPVLIIRDFGLGLSQEDVLQVYTKYGKSTKRGSDNAVGMLGIGSKSGFAYSDSFTITSHHGGTKKMYVAVLDKSEKGMINLLHEEPSGEIGVEIQIAIRPDDVEEFVEKGQALFQYFLPRPDTNVEIPALPASQATLRNGIIYDKDEESSYRRNEWVAVMGCVSYRINLEQLKIADRDDQEGVAAFIKDISGVLYFNIGEVQISASREELKYSAETKEKLVKRFNLLVEEYVTHTLQEINNSTCSLWEKRVKAQILIKLGLPVPKKAKDLVARSVGLGELPACFTIAQNKQPRTSITIADNVRLVVCDDRRAIQGFSLTENDYQVRRVGRMDWSVVESNLNKMCDELGLTGINIVKLSGLEWHSNRVRGGGGRTLNPKHRMKKRFIFKPNTRAYMRKPWSDVWEPNEDEPEPDDVFVIIEGFRLHGSSEDLCQLYSEDKEIALALKKTLPSIYGYRWTEKKPVDIKTCLGTEYREWRKAWVQTLVDKDVRDELQTWHRSEMSLEDYDYYHKSKTIKEAVEILTRELGTQHQITLFTEAYKKAQERMKKNPRSDGLAALVKRVDKDFVSEAQTELAAIYEKYPLLGLKNIAFASIWEEPSFAWLQYIKVIDQVVGD